MNKKLYVALLLLFSSTAFSAEGVLWEYSGVAGPDNWAKLSPDFSSCAGKNQSPVNLTGFIEAELEPISFNYAAGSAEILNNGHTVQVNVVPGNSITIDGIQFELKQFHFHAPSENLINGKSYPLEAHFVHANKNGNLAVVAVMFTEGETNKVLENAWTQMPHEAGGKQLLASGISPLEILPPHRNYYRFNGSLTTPPCSEGVRWMVLKHSVSASKEQIEKFTHVMHHPNNRPLQQVNARMILK